MTDYLNPKIYAAQQLIEDLTDQEKIFLLQAVFPSGVETDDQGQYVVSTEILAVDFVPEDPNDLSEFLDEEDDEDILNYLDDRDVRERYKTFVRDMVRAGFKDSLRIRYSGRNYYNGPACDCGGRKSPDYGDIARATKVPLQTDAMGLNYIAYPK